MEHVIDLDFIIYLAGAIASIAAASGIVSKIIKKGLQKTMKESVDKYYVIDVVFQDITKILGA